MTSTILTTNPSATPRAARNNHRSLSPEPFEIIAQSGEKFFAHSDILTEQSEPLSNTIASILERDGERKIHLLGWDVETVGRFIDYLYTKDYQVPILESGEDDAGCRRRMRLHSAYTPDTVQSQEERGVEDANMLLVHAKMYALAHCEDIKVERLKVMAFGRLKVALEGVGWHMAHTGRDSEVAKSIVELLRYIYTHNISSADQEEPIRDLVLSVATEKFEILMSTREMKLLLNEGGNITAQLMESMARRLCDVERRAHRTETELAACMHSLEFAETEAQGWRENFVVLDEKVQQLEEKVCENDKLKEEAADIKRLIGGERVIADMKRLYENERCQNQQSLESALKRRERVSPFLVGWFIGTKTYDKRAALRAKRRYPQQEPTTATPGWHFSLYDLLRFVVISVVVVIFSFMLHQETRQPPQPVHSFNPLPPGAIDGETFQGICQHYEAHSWTGSSYLTVGESPLREACSKHIPGKQVEQPSHTIEGTLKDRSHLYDANLWVGIAPYSIRGKSLKEVCIDNGLLERPSLKGKSIEEVCQCYEKTPLIGSDICEK